MFTFSLDDPSDLAQKCQHVLLTLFKNSKEPYDFGITVMLFLYITKRNRAFMTIWTV